MEDKWSYMEAYDKGWLNQNNSDETDVLPGDLDLFEILQ